MSEEAFRRDDNTFTLSKTVWSLRHTNMLLGRYSNQSSNKLSDLCFRRSLFRHFSSAFSLSWYPVPGHPHAGFPEILFQVTDMVRNDDQSVGKRICSCNLTPGSGLIHMDLNFATLKGSLLCLHRSLSRSQVTFSVQLDGVGL